MGLFSCIIFGILTTWLTGAIYPPWRSPGLKALLLTGVAGGLCGSMATWLCNIAYFSQFNIYGLLFSVVAVLLILWFYSKRKVASS